MEESAQRQMALDEDGSPNGPNSTLLKAGVAVACALLALGIYLGGLAPGLTWAHHGADGGELLAAAVTNGVPHPPGYPLYMLLLQGWLWLAGALAPASDLAWRGNLFSALCAATAVAVTVRAFADLPLPEAVAGKGVLHLLWAAAGGLLWGLAPLLWSQALITEVYTLHALGVALLGWAAFTTGSPLRLIPGGLLAASHHLTLLLLLPSALYAAAVNASSGSDTSRASTGAKAYQPWLRGAGYLGIGLLLGALVHLRTPLAASAAPPVNWGYADNWAGFGWLVSGAAYRDYLFTGDAGAMVQRLAAWLGTVGRETAWIGLLPMLAGLAALDAWAPRLRSASLLWVVPLSIYTVAFYTRDSELNMIGVSWMLALWVSMGLAALAQFSRLQWPLHATKLTATLAALVVVTLVLATVARWPQQSLRMDSSARVFLASAMSVLDRAPGSIIISRADAETFALWYGTWAEGRHSAEVLPVNDALYQYDWYRRLQAARVPHVAGADESAQSLVEQQAGKRPIFFAEPLDWAAERLVPVPPLWRYQSSNSSASSLLAEVQGHEH